MSRRKSILAEGARGSRHAIPKHKWTWTARQALVPFSIRFSSHVICGRRAVSNLQVSPQPCKSRWPQHRCCHGLNVNVMYPERRMVFAAHISFIVLTKNLHAIQRKASVLNTQSNTGITRLLKAVNKHDVNVTVHQRNNMADPDPS